MRQDLEGAVVGDPSWTPALPTLGGQVISAPGWEFLKGKDLSPSLVHPSSAPGIQQVFSKGHTIGRMLDAQKVLASDSVK